ncbi:MAG: YceI family protein, partial [Bacteroidetes bacterium]|nr:YceI family protein [Bacteroidota bacterium]
VFAGKILDHDKEDLTQEGKYEVEVEGDMTLHGCTRRICEKGILEVTDGKITGTSKFKIALKDYKIKIPRLVDEKVAEVIDVAVKVEYEAYRKGSGQ